MRKIFALLSILFIIMFSNAAAANDIDWDAAPRFGNPKDLVNYLNTCKNNLKTYVPVVLTDGFSPDVNDIVTLKSFLWLQYTDFGRDGKNTRMLYEITNYPGERVAYAYLHNDISFLDDEERQLYDEAVKIVNAAKYNSDNFLRQELYIHDAITDRTTYYTENPMPTYARFKTATGALLDGKANCQGYSDAFYMLCTMCGFNVDKVSGYGNGELHIWNTINFGDDKNYFVDVTFNDASFTFNGSNKYNNYIYFNAPTDVIKATHKWFSDYVPQNLQKYPDERYFFYTPEYNKSNGKFFGTHANSAEEALQHIAYNIARRGCRFSYVVAPYNETYYDSKYSLNRLLHDFLPRYDWKGYVILNVNYRGNYMFFTADAKAD